MYLSIPAGATSRIIAFPIFDSSSTTGAKLAGLVYNTASLTAYYNREGASGAAVAITLAAATKGTWVSGGFVAVDATNIPGSYELHLPDAALAVGAKSVLVSLKGAANMVPVDFLIELTPGDAYEALVSASFAEPGQEAPPATANLVTKIGYLYKFLRNKITQTEDTLSVYNAGGTVVDHKATTSDNDTTYTRGEIGSGP